MELPCGNGPSLPRNEGCVLGELRVAGLLPFHCSHSASEVLVRNRHSNEAFLSPRKRCDKEWDVVRDKKSKEEA